MQRKATLFRLTRLVGLILLCPNLYPFADEGRQVSGAEDRAAVGVASPPPALTVHLVRPDRQLTRLLDLFEGTRAPHPAAALSAWKRATRDPRGLGKAREAAIAMLNPEMVQEWKTLDRADLVVAFEAAEGQARWYATLPRDDGTFAALATALTLTDGGPDPPLAGVDVDRLGPPGAPLMSRVGDTVVAAGSRVDLEAARIHTQASPREWPTTETGVLFRLDPAAFGTRGPLWRRRLAEALLAAGCQSLDGEAGLEMETFRIALTGRLAAPAVEGRRIEPSWLDWVPASRVLAAFAVAIDPRADAWDTAFAVADRIERADPARAGVAPLRTRLNLIALAARVRPEVDLWPVLQGISGHITVNSAGLTDGALLALHAIDPIAAARLADRVLPALAVAARLIPPMGAPAEAMAIVPLGRLSGRPLSLTRRGATVLLSWGDLLPACLDAQAHPDRSAGPSIRNLSPPEAPQRMAIFWPGRLSSLVAPGSPTAFALSEAPPVVWWGDQQQSTTRDVITCTGLRGMVRRFLERLTMAE